MLSTAVAWDRIVTNPALRLRMPKPSDTTTAAVEIVLTPAQVDLMLAKAGSLRGETMLRCACEAGLRKGEIIALRWSDVLLLERRLRISGSVWQGKAGKRITHAPKSGKARRVAIGAALAGLLEAYYREAVIEGGAPEDGYVWPGKNGQALGRKTPNQFLERVLVRAKLTTPGEKKPEPTRVVPWAQAHGSSEGVRPQRAAPHDQPTARPCEPRGHGDVSTHTCTVTRSSTSSPTL